MSRLVWICLRDEALPNFRQRSSAIANRGSIADSDIPAADNQLSYEYIQMRLCWTLLLRSVVGCFCRKPLTDDETAGLPQQRTRLQTTEVQQSFN
ncbi:unnamed protein product [Peronospora belbahrii]|uniref:Uncharacterized protein n=1 Tax=Peronospora belbahrii TaxID=622444 RepID=A0ABN8D1W2_9STRA|nr:unnamed protein product [Peronospora belbahrii]